MSGVVVEKLEAAGSPRDALTVLAHAPRPFLLESSARGVGDGRWSFAGADPFLTVTARGRTVEIRSAEGTTVREGDPFEMVRALLSRFRVPGTGLPAPLPAGAVGFFSYDLGRQLERLPESARDDLGLPDISLGFHDAVATWDHETGEAFVVSTGLPLEGRAAARRAEERANALLDLLGSVGTPPDEPPAETTPLGSTFTRDEYVRAVSGAKDLIAAGDIFQVNLSQRFSTETEDSGVAIYRRLVRENPAPFAAYLAAEGGAEILSASPERFLRVADGTATCVPIKGTRPRGRDEEEDRALLDELLRSEKDRAELVMIVDLVRNDIGRVARFGSVRVPELFGATSHPTVHHLHGRVTAELAAGRDALDALRCSFPCGSITGAPKVRAMEIIEEFEPVRRGVYTGAIGYLSFSGEVDLSVAIRTLVLKNGRISFSVGGGIVADSDPDAEYRETLDKGRGLAAALGFTL